LKLYRQTRLSSSSSTNATTSFDILIGLLPKMRFEGKTREKLVVALNSFLREPEVAESTKEKVREAKIKLSS